MPAVVVDTDVVSFTFKRDTRAVPYRRHLVGRTLLVSFMTLAELDLWALRRNWGRPTRDRLERFLRHYVVQPYDRNLCRLWAEATDGARRKGRPIEVGDAWIAATALLAGVPLVTNNAADYAGVDGLTVLFAATP
jgi:predicted nucleic acid-binding protein